MRFVAFRCLLFAGLLFACRFHTGADISILSQFSNEAEVLFPPCTMLTVSSEVVADLSSVMRTTPPVEATVPPPIRFYDQEGDKAFITVRGTPTFL
eukprot:SAG22_NODE_404_length_11005_cov_8.751788_9_plen_96_part_00